MLSVNAALKVSQEELRETQSETDTFLSAKSALEANNSDMHKDVLSKEVEAKKLANDLMEKNLTIEKLSKITKENQARIAGFFDEMLECRSESLDHHYALVEHQYRLQDKFVASISQRKAKKFQAESACEHSAREQDQKAKMRSSVKSLDLALAEAIARQQDELACLRRLQSTRLALLELDQCLAENEKISAATEADLERTLAATSESVEAIENELKEANGRFSELDALSTALSAQHIEQDSAVAEQQDGLLA